MLEQATLLGAMAAALLGASARPYSPRIGRLKGDPGQLRVHARLAELLGGQEPLDDAPQAPVSFRVLPQVHGAAGDVLAGLEAQLERELRAVTDSPLWLEADAGEPAGFYPSGNFHSQALALALDSLAIAFAQVGALSEKRLHRLLDSRFSGLPEQLSPDPDRGHCGLVSLHKSVVGLCAENRLLAAPASVHAGDTSSGQEDFQAFTGLAADKLGRLLGQRRADPGVRARGAPPGARSPRGGAAPGARRGHGPRGGGDRPRHLRPLPGPGRRAGAGADSDGRPSSQRPSMP